MISQNFKVKCIAISTPPTKIFAHPRVNQHPQKTKLPKNYTTLDIKHTLIFVKTLFPRDFKNN